MSEESVVSSRLRDITESTEAEARDDSHQSHIYAINKVPHVLVFSH